MTQHWPIVILGGGFAGLACARQLEKVLGREARFRVLLVSSENYVTFYPLLPDVVGASIEPGHVIHPLRQLLRHCQVRRAEVSRVDLTRRVVEFDDSELVDHEPVEFEQLVLAFGSGNDMQVVPGMMEHALFVRTLADAIELRGHIVRRLEEANVESEVAQRRKLLHFVVVGGGFSGVEVAGQMRDLLDSALRFYPDLQAESPHVTLIHSQDHLLPELDAELGDRAQQSLERRGVTMRLKARVKAISGESVEVDAGEPLAAMNVVCTIGNTPHPVLASLDVEKVKGRVTSDEHLRLKNFDNVWAIGDGAICPDGWGGTCPPTGQFATRLGQHVGKNVLATLRQQPLTPFRHKSVGQLASIGHHNGVCKLYGLKFGGFVAWWLARTIHLLLLPGLERKLRVVIDWTLELFFPRDLNYLDLQRTEPIERMHVNTGETVFLQGETSHAFYVIQSGEVELTRRDANGQIVQQAVLKTGEHFGHGSLLHDQHRATTAVAISPCQLLAVGHRNFRMLFTSCAAIRQALQDTANRFRSPDHDLHHADWPAELLSLSVRDVMSSPVESLPLTATIADAFKFLAEKRRGVIPLIDASGRAVRLLTRTDLYRVVSEQLDLNAPAASIASDQLGTLNPTVTVAEAMSLLRSRRLKHAPVVDESGRPIGMLSTIDVALRSLQMRSPTAG